jgi:hypothetical protein
LWQKINLRELIYGNTNKGGDVQNKCCSEFVVFFVSLLLACPALVGVLRVPAFCRINIQTTEPTTIH